MKLDPDRRAGWWIFKLPLDDPYQAGANEHDDEFERKARGLPTARGLHENNELLERTWEQEEETILRPNQDHFARLYENLRQKLFRGFIWIASIPLWRSGRVTSCSMEGRAKCICLRDKDTYSNTP